MKNEPLGRFTRTISVEELRRQLHLARPDNWHMVYCPAQPSSSITWLDFRQSVSKKEDGSRMCYPCRVGWSPRHGRRALRPVV